MTALTAAVMVCGCALASKPVPFNNTAAHLANSSATDQPPQPVPEAKPAEQLPPPANQIKAGTTLAELEQLAKEQHPYLISAGEAIAAAAGRARQAGRPPNPTIGASSPQLAGSQSQYNAFMSQDVLTGGKLRLDSEAAQVAVEQAELAQVRAMFEVLTDVRKKFYAALALQSRVEMLRELQTITAKSAKLGDDLLKAGMGAKPDLLILQVEADKAEFALQNAQTNLVGALRQLAIAAGASEMAIERLAGNLDTEFPEFDWLSLQNSMEAQNAELAQADAEIRRSRILLDRATVEPSPKFNVMGGYQRQVEPAQDQGLFQLTMSVPLWDKNRGGIQAARANVMQAHADLARTRLSLGDQATDALKRYRVADQRVKKYEQEILPHTRESLVLTQQLYEKGEADFLDLLAIQRTMQEVNLSWLDSQEARAAAAAELAGMLQMEQFP